MGGRRSEQDWRVTTGSVTMTCASWASLLTLDGEWPLGRRCPNEALVRCAAKSLKQDRRGGGWME